MTGHSVFFTVLTVWLSLTTASGASPLEHLSSEGVSAQPRIEWRVKNQFPFLRQADQFEKLKQGLAVVKSSGSFGAYAAAVREAYKQTAWNAQEKRYDRDLVHSPNLDVEVRVVDVEPAMNCVWRNEIDKTVPCSFWTTLSVKRGAETQLTAFWGDQQSVTTAIQPSRRIILGFGDSFSSGEGNPDRPVSWNEAEIPANEARYYQRRWPTTAPSTAFTTAEWNDVACHRSLFSWQFLRALDIAGRDPHEETVFISFACSGAEVFDGVLVQQYTRDKMAKAPGPQLSEAVALLCKTTPTTVMYGTKKHAIQFRDVEVSLLACKADDLVTPDEVLLTLGGNDVGFGGLIAWASFPSDGYTRIGSMIVRIINEELTPKTGMVCPHKNSLADPRCSRLFAAADEFSTGRLKFNLALTHELLSSHLGVPLTHIFQLTYPSPLNDETGAICSFDRAAAASRAMKNELFTKLTKLDLTARWSPRSLTSWRYPKYNVGPAESKVEHLKTEVVKPLQETIKGLASNGVRVVDTSDAFQTHGYCAKPGLWDLEMPTQHAQQTKGWRWWPSELSPGRFDAYASVDRWFRTPNDAQLVMLSDALYGGSAWTEPPRESRRPVGLSQTVAV
jgi:hypothetical protein